MFGLNAFGKVGAIVRRAFSGGGFTPLSLFAASEQGIWLDPSDLSTMFQDSAGTTPVTAVGQPVGKILDKSKGLVLGAELVTNGDFASGSTGWTLGAGWSVSGGKLNASTSQYTRAWYLVGASAFVSGKTYKIEFDVSNFVSGTFLAFVSTSGGPKSGAVYFITTGNGHKTCFITATDTVTGFGFEDESGAPPSFSIDNISIKELAGNHASQATAAKRPLLQNDGVNNYLAFDGVDDALATASINFTATDKMSVFSGFNTSDNTGFDAIFQFGSVAPGGVWSYFNTNVLEYKAQGASSVSTISTAYSPSIKSVATTLINLGGVTGADCLSVRKNGAVLASASVVAGGGNFQNGVLQVASATGVYLSGRIYSLIVLGRLATMQEITDTETWVKSKTGAY